MTEVLQATRNYIRSCIFALWYEWEVFKKDPFNYETSFDLMVYWILTDTEIDE